MPARGASGRTRCRLLTDRQQHAHGEAASRLAPGVELPAVERNALLHPDEAMATAGDARLGSGSVVDYLQLERVVAVADHDARTGVAGVLQRVGERLLN